MIHWGYRKVHWLAAVNTVMNYQVPRCMEFLEQLSNYQFIKDSGLCN